VKTEEEDVKRKSGGFLCPSCGAHYFNEEYFIEHVREHDHPKSELLVQSEDNEQSEFNKLIVDSGIENDVADQQGCDCIMNYSDLVKSEVKTDLREGGGFSCSECGENYQEEYDFLGHIKIHVYDKRNVVPLDKGQTCLNSRKPAAERPFKCSKCSYATAKQSHSTKHLRTHIGERPYKCSQCSFAAARKSHLTSHFRTHTGERPF
jgi:KRAB domain-containing zinc finger protein